MKHIATLFLSVAAFAAFAADVHKTALNDLDLDANPQVVTNVTFAGLATTNDVAAATANAVKLSENKPEENARIVLWDYDAASNNPRVAGPIDLRVGDLVPGDYENISNRVMRAISLPGDEGHPGGLFTPRFVGRANLADGALALTKSGQIAYPGSLQLRQRWYEDAYGAISGVMWPSFLDAEDTWHWAASEDYVNSATNAIPRDFLPLAGGKMRGNIDMGGSYGGATADPTDSAFLEFLDWRFGNGVLGAGFGIYQDDGDGFGARYLFNGARWYDDGSEEDVMTREDLADALSDIAPPEVDLTDYATHAQATNAARAVSAPLEENVGVLWQYVFADSVWLAVTNYMRTVDGVVPSLQLWEVRNGSTNLVYHSTEEISNAVNSASAALRAEITNAMPDKAWSRYQSATGAENPQPTDITIISTPKVMLTGGGEWNRYVNTGGSAIWVLHVVGNHVIGGGANGSFFRVEDDEGNAQFEVSRTDSYEVNAIPESCGWDEGGGNGNFQVTFNAPSTGNQPVLYATTNLVEAFVAEENGEINSLGVTVNWSSAGGLWRATIVQDTTAPALFVHAKVLQEGSVVIRNNAPTTLDGGLFIGNTKYRVVPATISGKTVLTLEVAP